MKSACFLLLMFGVALSGCGREPDRAAVPSSPAAPNSSAAPNSPAAQSPPAGPPLIHSPPIAQLPAEQLRSLSMECEKYVPDKSARGPYDAAYCEEAIAAWSDSPLQMIPILPKPDSPKPSSPQ
jgi:hypothetical protein